MVKTALFVGKAIVDFYAEIPQSELCSNGLVNNINFLSNEDAGRILESFGNRFKMYFGGAEANAAVAASALGLNSCFSGSIGDDGYSQLYKSEMAASGVDTYFQSSQNGLSRVITIIDPGTKQRTKAVSYGSSEDIVIDSTLMGLIAGCDVFYTSFYSFWGQLYGTMEEMTAFASANSFLSFNFGGSIGMDKKGIRNILKYADIIFSNEAEAKNFAETDSIYDCLKLLSEFSEIVVITLAENGSVIKNKDRLIQIPALQTRVIRPEGAGDAYSAAFLSAVINGESLEAAAKLGTKVAAYKISTDSVRFKPAGYF